MFNATIASTSLLIYLQYPFLPLVFIMPFLVVFAKMTDWTVQDVLNCIKIVLNDDIVARPSEDDLEKYEVDEPEEFLLFLFNKSERIGEVYDSINMFEKDLVKAWDMPEYYRYGYDKQPGTEFTENLHGGATIYKDEKGNEYTSKHDMILMFLAIFENIPMHNMVSRHFSCWINHLIRQKYENMENTYELIPYSIVLSMEKSAEEIKCQGEFEGDIREEDLFELRKYFDAEYEHVVVDHFKKLLDKFPVSSEKYQVFYKKIYMDIKGTIEKALKVHENFKDSLEPSTNPLPIVRCFTSKISEKPMKFYFEKEVFNAIKYLRKDLKDEFESDAETEKERKCGIVHMMNEQTFVEILEKYKISMAELTILKKPYYSFSTMIVSPIISNYGTFCKLATDAFREVVRYMIRNMEIFKNIYEVEFANLIMWIETNLADFFGKSGKIYAIEMWKIEEKIGKLKNDWKLKKSSIYTLRLKESYEKSEILDFVQKSFQPLNLDLEVFEFHYTKIMDNRIPKKSDIYELLNMCFENKIILSLKDLRAAFDQQNGDDTIIVDLNNAMKELGIDEKLCEVVEKVKEIANYTLAHFEVGETQPISKFEKLLEIPNFRKTFDDNSWKYLKNFIFKNLEKTKQLMKNFEHLYDFEDKNGELLFSKREQYIGDLESIRLIEKEEMERISEKMRDENKKLRSIVDAIQGQMKDERKRHQEEVQKIKEDHQKCEEKYAEDMSDITSRHTDHIRDLKNELDSMKKSKIDIEKTLKKKENEVVSTEKIKKNLENQLKTVNKEKSTIEKKLEKMENDLASVETSKKSLENQLKNMKHDMLLVEKSKKNVENQLEAAETSRKNLEDELRIEKSSNIEIHNQLIIAETSRKTVENELNLTKVNKKPRGKVLKKIKNLESWFENGIEKMNRISENHRKLSNYERILKISKSHEEIFANLNKLLQKFPSNAEIFRARNQLFKKSDFDRYVEDIREQIQRIQENPEGEFEELQFVQVMKKYEQWVEEYL
ncbi:unnamed protein product [Caenorhabditis angaria]|uniref:Uncharacterized protein n=1 Tax=Caenorhabditis angaria TaxID=860376 RepID=A0A9P1IH74_9PELO|nr:unnamed protein product [Caenorhabditis angaria]